MYNTELVNHKFVETYETLVRDGVKIDILTELTQEEQEILEKDLRHRRDIVTINWLGWRKNYCHHCGAKMREGVCTAPLSKAQKVIHR